MVRVRVRVRVKGSGLGLGGRGWVRVRVSVRVRVTSFVYFSELPSKYIRNIGVPHGLGSGLWLASG